jgi:hypothetical protein
MKPAFLYLHSSYFSPGQGSDASTVFRTRGMRVQAVVHFWVNLALPDLNELQPVTILSTEGLLVHLLFTLRKKGIPGINVQL